MAASWSVVKGNIRRLLGDENPSHYAFDSDRLLRIADTALPIYAARAKMGPEWLTGANGVALSDAATSDYDLPTTVQYDRVLELVLASTNRPLERISLDQIDRMLATAPQHEGDPRIYALIEGSTQTVKARLWPIPNATDVLNIYRSQIPTVISSDITSIPFSTLLLRGFEQEVAGACVSLMDQEEMTRLKLTKDAAKPWFAAAAIALYEERKRKSQLSRTDIITVGSRGY